MSGYDQSLWSPVGATGTPDRNHAFYREAVDCFSATRLQPRRESVGTVSTGPLGDPVLMVSAADGRGFGNDAIAYDRLRWPRDEWLP